MRPHPHGAHGGAYLACVFSMSPSGERVVADGTEHGVMLIFRQPSDGHL